MKELNIVKDFIRAKLDMMNYQFLYMKLEPNIKEF